MSICPTNIRPGLISSLSKNALCKKSEINYIMIVCCIYNACFHNAIAALFNVDCLYNAYILPLTFFHALAWVIDTVCLLQILYGIMHSGFNLLVFLIWCSQYFCLFNERAMCSLEK